MVNKYHKSAREYLVDIQFGILKKKRAAKGKRKSVQAKDRNYLGGK